jgi:hypothetical protein
MSPTEPAQPIDATDAELEELEALCRAQYRNVALVSVLRLFGPVLLIGLLVAIGAFTYIQVTNFRTRAREELAKDPIRGMETIMRAAGKDVDMDLPSGAFDFEEVERQMRSMETKRRRN